ncbi:MerR family transcriptional regulator [Herbiconiux sp. P15]|uniref:MerR family transcriptional regulator n=1 Tax=Herbiconiux liukaitaii TaxID=3342799 RepID=UPI0035B875A3
MRIGELSERTGASIRSLRYYEERGLIRAERSPSGQRHYAVGTVERVRLIRDLLAASLGTEAIADVLPCIAEPATRTTALTDRLVAERDRLEAEILHRTTMRDALQQLIDEAPPLPPTRA